MRHNVLPYADGAIYVTLQLASCQAPALLPHCKAVCGFPLGYGAPRASHPFACTVPVLLLLFSCSHYIFFSYSVSGTVWYRDVREHREAKRKL